MTAISGNDEPAGPLGTATLDSRLPLQKSNRTRNWISAAMGVVIFAAGGICGAAATRVIPKPKPLTSLSELPRRVAERMQYDLGLTDAQRQSIEQIVQAHQPQLHRIRARIVPEMRTELRQLVEEMSAVLGAEQAKRFRPQAEHRLDVHFPLDDVTPEDEPGPVLNP